MNAYWVYILASKPHGTLYIGVTNNILGRVAMHREGKGSIFTRKYRVKMLVHFEEFADVRLAIQREKTLKHYTRDWKLNLIERDNPHWIDLYPSLLTQRGLPSDGVGGDTAGTDRGGMRSGAPERAGRHTVAPKV